MIDIGNEDISFPKALYGVTRIGEFKVFKRIAVDSVLCFFN